MAENEDLQRADELGTTELNRTLLTSSLRLAVSGKSATALRYWLENKLKWRRYRSVEISGIDGGPVEVTDMRGVALARLEQFLRNQE